MFVFPVAALYWNFRRMSVCLQPAVSPLGIYRVSTEGLVPPVLKITNSSGLIDEVVIKAPALKKKSPRPSWTCALLSKLWVQISAQLSHLSRSRSLLQ